MGMLHPGHTLAPLLSPRAPLPSQRELPSQRMSPRNKQEFAIPPIVPSQQHPPLTAHPSTSSYHPYMASPMYQRNSANNSSSSSSNNTSNSSNHNNHQQQQQQQQPATAALPTTARDVPLPPQTPTTNSFGSLQRQQFLQPFEHLFETIETSRTLKSTLDDQIRRSSTLMQTLQASSTTIEGLVRNQIKEAQKELMTEMDAAFESILQRIEKLERTAGKRQHRAIAAEDKRDYDEEDEEEEEPELPLPHHHRQGQSEQEDEEGTSAGAMVPPPASSKSNGFLRSPPTIVRSQNDIGPNEYHGLLNALRERLDRLERQFDT
ncbi:hypothetical protein BDB00DRAFT_849355 [Zychaea mexicana]|uniref:uncharacterized protein n=1 Tax=Zychaea mexicana TaxID=64656 RepID=UPI0022FE3DC6|nr:uncharacterized protein BDB00DRAFT_849355 [Zychaea mexicana]KAI9488210.1 hypothetical protein BDB00DRAFT_849355 [Zychaea mexicana]